MVARNPAPYILPFFIPHIGCPHQCVFCNQHGIAGVVQPVTPPQISQEIKELLRRPRDQNRVVQVAFYGGSFTGLDLSYQRRLLGAVAPFIQSGQVQGIRLSTRPDCLDAERVSLLLEYGVSLVEIGVQSLAGEVLQASGRGHCPEQVSRAFSLLQEYGLEVGGQLMVGLPCDTRRRSIDSCRRLIALKPDCVRIYPTLVMAHTPLAELYRAGEFKPWSLAKTVVVVARMKEMLDHESIPVIRMGLQAGESLHENIIAGPYHPAFGELVMSRLFFKKVRRVLSEAFLAGKNGVRLILSFRDQSLFMGIKKENYLRLQAGGWLQNVEVCFSETQPRFVITTA